MAPANFNPTETRMARLAVHADAYLQPTPTSFTSGGIAKATRGTIVLLKLRAMA